MELLGRMPRVVTSRGKYVSEFFNRRGELKRIRCETTDPCGHPDFALGIALHYVGRAYT
eukprot:SAG11_NODE_1203_length_5535_cov_13.559235_3_plen_59_part_00